jgi:hypothetical protein
MVDVAVGLVEVGANVHDLNTSDQQVVEVSHGKDVFHGASDVDDEFTRLACIYQGPATFRIRRGACAEDHW